MGTLMKKLFLAVVIGGAVFGTVFAFAASLGLTSNDLASGDAVVASCDIDATANNVSYTTSYSGAANGYVVNTAVVTGLSTPACDNQLAKATLSGAANAPLEQASATVGAGGTLTFTFAGTTLASNVTGVHVLITE
jgi:hypothetical protein